MQSLFEQLAPAHAQSSIEKMYQALQWQVKCTREPGDKARLGPFLTPTYTIYTDWSSKNSQFLNLACFYKTRNDNLIISLVPMAYVFTATPPPSPPPPPHPHPPGIHSSIHALNTFSVHLNCSQQEISPKNGPDHSLWEPLITAVRNSILSALH